jgi:Arc/MetJ-type ribon-helix-helix transcriptional regulator
MNTRERRLMNALLTGEPITDDPALEAMHQKLRARIDDKLREALKSPALPGEEVMAQLLKKSEARLQQRPEANDEALLDEALRAMDDGEGRPAKEVLGEIRSNVSHRELPLSVNIELPPETEAFIKQRIAAADTCGEIEVWTTVIHEALWKMRNAEKTQEELRRELEDALLEGVEELDSGQCIPGEKFFSELRANLPERHRELQEARAQGLIGNLLLPKELHAFVTEEVASGAFPSPTELVVEALRRLEAGDA